MSIVYSDTKKDLPPHQLQRLFSSAGWSDESKPLDAGMLEKFNVPFINSTLVISAWDGEILVGVVRVLSDQFIRSILYDLVILPEYQSQGIGKELVGRCIAHFPNTEWLVQTTADIAGYYEKRGFTVNSDVFLTIPFRF